MWDNVKKTIAFWEGLPKSKRTSSKGYLAVKDSVGDPLFETKLQFFSFAWNIVEPCWKMPTWSTDDSIPILWPETYCYQVIGHDSGT